MFAVVTAAAAFNRIPTRKLRNYIRRFYRCRLE